MQGFGNVGAVTAQLFHEAGALIVGVSDSAGGVFSDDGLNIQAVLQHKGDKGTVVGTPDTLTISNDELNACNCDILIPAALGAAINAGNAADVSASLIVEAGNEPVTPEAEVILSGREVQIILDILANSGGVTVSHFEWMQNLANERWNSEEIDRRLHEVMAVAVDRVMDRWEKLTADGDEELSHGLDLRTAALVSAIEHVANVTLQRGIWP